MENLTELVERLDVSRRPHVASNRGATAGEHPQSSNKKKFLVFEKSNTEGDAIAFASHKGPVQVDHKTFKQHTKYVYLKDKKAEIGVNGKAAFKRELNNQMEQVRYHKGKLSQAERYFGIDSKISVKLGYEYFYSRLFKWETVMNIQELKDLDLYKVPNSNQNYYKPLQTLRDFEKNKRIDEKFQRLKSSFTDQVGIKNVQGFKSSLSEMGFRQLDKGVSYKLLVNNKQKLIERVFDGIENVDNGLIEQLALASKLELKFNCEFQLQSITIKQSSANFTMYSSNVDLLRATLDNTNRHRVVDLDEDIERKLDVRYQVQQFCRLDSNSYEQFDLIQQAFNGFLKNDRSNYSNLIVKCQPLEIEFLRCKDFLKYEWLDNDIFVQSPAVLINDNIDYRVAKCIDDKSIVLEPNEMVENFIKASVRLVLKDESEKSKNEFIAELWKFGVMLSDTASLYLH